MRPGVRVSPVINVVSPFTAVRGSQRSRMGRLGSSVALALGSGKLSLYCCKYFPEYT